MNLQFYEFIEFIYNLNLYYVSLLKRSM